jgi:glucosamine--fructose-6-phosphate aminotransferase (isomerizing)
VAISADEPDVIVGARKECPLVVGVGNGERFVASAIPAFLRETREVQLINDDEIVTIRPDSVEFQTASGEPLEREIEHVTWDDDAAEKAGYPTFMLKEIHEQSDAVAETIADRLAHGDHVDLGELGISDDELARIRRVVIVACGTSYHAGLVGRYAIEQWARVPVEMDIASEYRYRNPVVGPDDLVVGISQSGETADTLAAMRLARDRGAKVLAITNILGSQATRDAHGVLYTRAGLEIGVAATKTFVAQVAAIYLLGLKLAQLGQTLDRDELVGLIADLKGIPRKIDQLISSCEEQVRAIARSHANGEFFLYLGRHIGLAVCLEGALKLKEITYIPADAYAAGEMKHGPIALLGERTPVVCVATDSPVLDKILSNMAEVEARGAVVIAVATEGAEQVAAAADQTVFVPHTDWILQPILAVIPLQLLAYDIARLRGLNVDQPRNLAKTVTVE